MFKDRQTRSPDSVQPVRPSDFDSVRELIAKSGYVIAGRESLLERQGYLLDGHDGEAIFGVYRSKLIGAVSVKRTHFSWDIWGVGVLAIDSEEKDYTALSELLLSSVRKYILEKSTTPNTLLMLTTTEWATIGPSGLCVLDGLPNRPKHRIILQSLNGRLELESPVPHHPDAIPIGSSGVSIRPLDHEGIRAAADIVDKVWGVEDRELFVEENIRFQSDDALVCGAFSEARGLVGAATIKRTYFDDSVWGLAWAVVSPEVQGSGIGSAMTAYRLQYAREQTPNGVAMIVTTNPSHALKSGFEVVARYGCNLEKQILLQRI